jgi:hypothetical protein
VVDARLWPEDIHDVPMSVWPMTRRGLAHAARELGGIATPPGARVRVLAEGHVTVDGIERVKRLATLVPHPSADLLELLRQRFAPDVPDAAIAYLAHEANAAGLRTIRLADDDVRRYAAEVRRESPRLEAAVRKQIVATLQESEPPRDSVAHLRWQLTLSLQELSLARLQNADASTAAERLRVLQHGPLWEEVRSALALGGAVASGPPPDDGRLAGWRRRPITLPGVREALGAAVAVAVVVGAGWLLAQFPTTTLAHVEDAYALTAVGSGNAQALEVRRLDAGSPQVVDIYQDDRVFRAGVTIPESGASTVSLEGGEGYHYRARATLPRGNLATSPPVWIPAPGQIVILIDAHPWARVSIQGADTAIEGQVTPVRIAIAPGTYRVRLENGGITDPLEGQITVSPAQLGQRFSFPMPGFDPDAAAAGQ